MKKIVCFFMVFMLAALLVVPCFAAETTAAPSDPVDWFGGETTVVGGYVYTGVPGINWRNIFPSGASNAVTALEEFSFTSTGYPGNPESGNNIVIHAGDSFYLSGDTLYVNGSQVTQTYAYQDSDVIISYKCSNQTVVTRGGSVNGTAYYITVGSDGFVNSGVSDALTELSLIVSAILSNQYILIAIGLAVAVPLVAWGISKIKSLVKGY